jgi:hypothetical protein
MGLLYGRAGRLTAQNGGFRRGQSTLELMQIVLIGLVAFALVDRVSGLYLGIAADIEWSMKLFDPILQIPGAWVGVNAGSWLVLSLIMLLVMRRVRCPPRLTSPYSK